jgi:tetratricopeptide (TPR) repeat protein
MPSYDFRVKRGGRLASGCRHLPFVRSLQPLRQAATSIKHSWCPQHLVLGSVVVAGLVSTAALAESLRLEPQPALADKKRNCLDSKDHDLRIESCSAMIQHNPKDVVAHHNRGDAYGLKGEIDRAISDYTVAIVLNPNYAPAYNSRGRAYTSKGDYLRAVADVTKARELIGKEHKRKGTANKKPAEESWWAWAIRKLTN